MVWLSPLGQVSYYGPLQPLVSKREREEAEGRQSVKPTGRKPSNAGHGGSTGQFDDEKSTKW